MPVFAKDSIEVGNLLQTKPPLVEPTEPLYKITGETEAQMKNREVQNKEKECVGKINV